MYRKLGLLISLTSLLFACGPTVLSQNPDKEADPAEAQPHPTPTAPSAEPEPQPDVEPALQYDGSIALDVAVSGNSGKTHRVEISGPIMPKMDVLYAHGEGNYPATDAERQQLAHDSSLTFPVLLQECPAKYPDIKVRGPLDPPLTPAELAMNYELIAQCAYEQFTSKPYWFPQIIDDVDICGNELGSGWHLITEADIKSMSEKDFKHIAATLAGTPNTTAQWGFFYFSLHVWVRASNGELKRGDLTPGVTTRVGPLPPTVGGTTTSHLESDMGLRCIRSTTP